jgi:hypothetical protein
MPNLVRAVIGDRAVNVSPEFAESEGLEVLDEPTHFDDGRLRPETKANGRPLKPTVTVAPVAAGKKAGSSAADDTTPSKEK